MIDSQQIVCVGSISFDLIFQVDRMPQAHEKLRCPRVTQACGGSAANTAHWLARLGHRVAFAGCVGDDEMGRVCTAGLEAVGVNTQCVQRTSAASTGIATIFVSPGDKRMVTASGANACFDPGRLNFEAIGPQTHVHVSLLDDDKAVPVLRESKRRGASTSCEFNGVHSARRVELCDICFMNSDELGRWMGPDEPLERWQERFGDLDAWLVVTQGEAGATAIRHEEAYQAQTFSADVVDRTGGGDAFDAGFLSGVIRQLGPLAALEVGLKLAREVIRHLGAANPEIDAATVRAIANWPET